MTHEDMKHLATETLARLETDYDNPARMLEHLHDDAEWHAIVQPPGSRKWNKAEFAIMWQGIRQLGETAMHIWPTAFVVEGNKVAMEAESYMKLRNGKEYRNQYHYLFEFRDGKIACVKEYMDTAYAFRMFEL